ncbi:MAG: hypothetical protein LBL00_04160, partial [Endomicrobium sp.]|nr:hypothetical protein [Endomicrobium sp.]
MCGKKLFFSFILLLTACASAFSSVRNSGRIINENPSVRGAGMGYAYGANIVDDAFGIFSNPAYIPPSSMAGFSYSVLFKEGISESEWSHGAFSFLYPDLFAGINIGVAAVSSLEGNIKNEQDSAIYLNLSKQIDFLRFGVNAKYINSAFYRDSDSDFITADIGLSATFGIFTAAIAGYNLFGEFKDAVSGEKITPFLSAAAALNFNLKSMIFAFEAEGVKHDLKKSYINPRAGLEVFYRFVSLRCGYEYDDKLRDKGLLSAGFGLKIKNVILDYAFTGGQNGFRGDIHKTALSCKFYSPPKVNNEQYIRQIKYEKQQAKLEKQKRKRIKSASEKNKHTPEKTRKPQKNKTVPFLPVEDSDNTKEFIAVLIPEEIETRQKPDSIYEETDEALSKSGKKQSEKKREKNKRISRKKSKQIHVSAGAGEFDSAKYILENPGKHQVKKYYDYAKPDQIFENEFDAARYILANPGMHKIKQYYAKPTPTSENDFDAAHYLLQNTK